MIRSIVVIVAGFVLIGVLSVCTDLLVRLLVPGAFTPDGGSENILVLLGSQVYVGVYATFGCWLTARLAPNRPMRHALILGALGFVFNVAGLVAAKPGSFPVWYMALSLVLVMPYAWLGGRIRERQLAAT